MAAIQSSTLIALALHDGPAVSTSPPFGRLVLVSLALHGMAVLMVSTLSLSGSRMEPLMSQEVTLVSLPKEQQRSSRPQKLRRAISSNVVAQRQKASSVIKPKAEHVATPPPLATVQPLPSERPVKQAPSRSEVLMREALASLPQPPQGQPPPPREPQARPDEEFSKAMSKIELPPEAPQFKELRSVPNMDSMSKVPSPPARDSRPVPSVTQSGKTATTQLQDDVDSLLEKLKVPQIAATSRPGQGRPPAPVRAEKKPSLSEEVRSKLQSIEQLQQAQALRAVETPVSGKPKPDVPVSEPVREAKAVEQAPHPRKPAALIQAAEAAPGSSGYLTRVQNKISQHWIAPPVDLSGQSLVVVIRFRLHRSGTVSDVVVEQPSGNQYYDMAAERAIRSADPLPSFPTSLSEVYLDTHFTFTVGEQVG